MSFQDRKVFKFMESKDTQFWTLKNFYQDIFI